MNPLKKLFMKKKHVSITELFVGFNKSMKTNVDAMHVLRDSLRDIYDSRELDLLSKRDRNDNR